MTDHGVGSIVAERLADKGKSSEAVSIMIAGMTIANLFGVPVRRIQQLTQEGVLPTTETPEGRRYDLVPTIQKYVKYLSDKAYGKNRSEKEMDLREQKLQADIALKEAQGELHNMKLSVASGQLVDVEKVKEDYSRFFTTFKKFAMSLPGRLTSMVSGYVEPLEARKIERDLQGEVNRQLEAFYLAAVTEIPDKGNGSKPKAPDS